MTRLCFRVPVLRPLFGRLYRPEATIKGLALKDCKYSTEGFQAATIRLRQPNPRPLRH